MKTLLARLTPHKGIGLFIDEHEIVVSKVASTSLGLVELATEREAYTPETFIDVLWRLLGPLVNANKRVAPIAVGISTRRVFYSTRLIRNDSDAASPQALLRDVLQSPNVCIDEMTVEVSKGEFAKRKLASVASCRKDYLFELLGTLRDCGIQPFRTEPAPLALLRAAVLQRRVRRSKPAVRIFMGAGHGLAVVTAGALCILWKSFKFSSGGEKMAIGTVIRSCQSLIRHSGVEAPIDIAIVHGRSDLRSELTAEEFVQKAGVQVACCDGPALDGTAVAYGLALSCVQDQSDATLDLTQSITPSPSLWRVFPWGEAAIQIALVICMGLFLSTRSHSAEQMVSPMRAELQRHAWVGKKNQAELNKEKQELTIKVEAVRKFVSSRIQWTQYTHDISERLPGEATLIAFQGICELEQSGKSKSKPKKSFLVRATAEIDEDGTAPKEIDEFLAALRFHPLLQRDFPIVELADIKTSQATKGQPASALFTVVCLPKAVGGPAAALGGKKEGHK